MEGLFVMKNKNYLAIAILIAGFFSYFIIKLFYNIHYGIYTGIVIITAGLIQGLYFFLKKRK